MKNEMLETVRRWLKSFSTLAAVCTVPFVVVSILQVDFLSVWRMALAYAIAVFSRQGSRLIFGEKRKSRRSLWTNCWNRGMQCGSLQ